LFLRQWSALVIIFIFYQTFDFDQLITLCHYIAGTHRNLKIRQYGKVQINQFYITFISKKSVCMCVVAL